jgi:phage recombination protein Bet
MSEEKGKQIIEFVPFGTKDKIQLSIELVKRMIAVKTKTGKTCTDEDAFRFMLMCQARKLNPFEGDAFLIGYDGQHGASFSLITAHQAFLKRAELHPEFDGMDSGTIVLREGNIHDLIGDWHMPNDRVLGGWATVFFKNRAHPMKKRVRLERFNKGYGIWKDDPAGMIVKCAEADALRSSFPTMLGGMFITEEIEAAGAADIARPVFPGNTGPAAANGGTVVDVEPTPVPPAPERKVEEPKKKAPTLTRKSPAAPAARSIEKKAETPHQKFAALLAVGNCTPDDFIAMALDEGWIDLEQTFDKIPTDRVAEFMRDENWAVIMELLDQRAAKRASEAAAKGDLL